MTKPLATRCIGFSLEYRRWQRVHQDQMRGSGAAECWPIGFSHAPTIFTATSSDDLCSTTLPISPIIRASLSSVFDGRGSRLLLHVLPLAIQAFQVETVDGGTGLPLVVLSKPHQPQVQANAVAAVVNRHGHSLCVSSLNSLRRFWLHKADGYRYDFLPSDLFLSTCLSTCLLRWAGHRSTLFRTLH